MQTKTLRLLLNVSMSPYLGCRLRGALLRSLKLDIDPTAKISRGTRLGGNHISFGRYAGANEECWIDDHVSLEDNVRMGPRVMILTQSHTIGTAASRLDKPDTMKPVRIGAGSWLHAQVSVMPGAHVAPGCVILAGSVVTKPTLPNGIYAGAPAKRIKNLAIDTEPSVVLPMKSRRARA